MHKMKKLFLLMTVLFLFQSVLFSQESSEFDNNDFFTEASESGSEQSLTDENDENDGSIFSTEREYVDEKNMSVSEVEELLQSGKLINRLDFVFGITPTVFFNTHTKNKDGIFISAKSPVLFPVYFGMSVPNYTAVSFQPTLKIFSSYNLVYEDMVLPAEIENRTGLTYSFLLNLPVVFKLNYKNKCSWSLSSGIAGLFRFAVLPDGVQTDESGYTGTVESDIKFMNSWFYENLRFLYLSAGFDWMFYYGKTKYGPEISIYFPISTFTDKSADGMMVSVGVKVEF